jgi:hypothetical protein
MEPGDRAVHGGRQRRGVAWTWAALLSGVAGCNVLTGVDSLTKVDCSTGQCTPAPGDDAGPDASDTTLSDGSVATDAPDDAASANPVPEGGPLNNPMPGHLTIELVFPSRLAPSMTYHALPANATTATIALVGGAASFSGPVGGFAVSTDASGAIAAWDISEVAIVGPSPQTQASSIDTLDTSVPNPGPGNNRSDVDMAQYYSSTVSYNAQSPMGQSGSWTYQPPL